MSEGRVRRGGSGDGGDGAPGPDSGDTGSLAFARLLGRWPSILLKNRDSLLAVLIGVVAFAAAAPGARRYGLTWDEPTYFRFARQQRRWLAEVFGGLFHPGTLGRLFTRPAIAQVWLQHPQRNGHPPLNEVWMGVVGSFVQILGYPNVVAFRVANSLLLAITTLLLFHLLRQGVSRLAAVVGAILYLGIPAIWAHGHLGATESMQNFFWVLLGLLLPRTLRKGGRWLLTWTLVCALSFMAKFTNILIPFWVLGTAGILGAARHRRFWICALAAVVIGPLLILLLDPFFWPWQGGVARFADYLRQATTRAHWVPIGVFYEGRIFGFRPPWHYRLVETLATLPVSVLVLFLPGLYVGARAVVRGVTRAWLRPGGAEEVRAWLHPRGAEEVRARLHPGGVEQVRASRGDEAESPQGRGFPIAGPQWPAALGITGVIYTLIVGWLPGTPNHDGTRQFVFMFVFVALLAGSAAEAALQATGGRLARGSSLRARAAPGAVLLLLSLLSFAISLLREPWGLSYHSEWIGGTRGAWAHGFELTYWCETISPEMLSALDRLTPADGRILRVHTIPKIDYFIDAGDFVRPLLSPGSPVRQPFAADVSSAAFAPWAAGEVSPDRAPLLSLSFQDPPDALIVSYRRNTVGPEAWDLFEMLARAGDLRLVNETLIDGLPLARLYAIPKLVLGKLPEDPTGQLWYQLPAVAARVRYLEEKARMQAPEREQNH